jgi:hypothetical protein
LHHPVSARAAEQRDALAHFLIVFLAADRVAPDKAGSAPAFRRAVLRMRLAEVLIPKADAFCQLAAEKEWLRGNTPGSMLARQANLPSSSREIAQRVESVLVRTELRNVLEVVATHNRNRPNRNRSSLFLLGPYLFNIIHSLEARSDTQLSMPALGWGNAELRAHYRKASANAKELARLVRKAPQPHIALAAHDEDREAFTPFLPCPIIQSPSQSETIVSLDRLLNDAAASIDSLTKKIRRAHQHRKVDRLQLRHLATCRLVIEFRNNLGRPYHTHVAKIVEALTGITTDADYVRKVDERNLRYQVKGQKL